VLRSYGYGVGYGTYAYIATFTRFLDALTTNSLVLQLNRRHSLDRLLRVRSLWLRF